MRNILISFLLLIYFVSFAQYATVTELAVLSSDVNETSGLIYFNDKLITINDSGNPPFLYEIDTLTGNVIRTVIIDNATNIDWEDIAQDSLYIYIADIGNNSGDRTDLKIYRISKTEYLLSNNVTAEVINFSYNNQSDFTPHYRNTEFDAEALSGYNDSLIIFMKNWVNNTTRTYTLSKNIGTHIANQQNTYNCNGLITGSEYNAVNNSFALCGYTSSLHPFIISISDIYTADIFSGTITKTNLIASISEAQVEGICVNNTDRYFMSSEKFTYQTIVLEPKLYSFLFSNNISNIMYNNSADVKIYPNPAHNYISIETGNLELQSVEIINIAGTKMLVNTNTNIIDISLLKKGIYFIILRHNKSTEIIKFIKE